MSSQPVKIVLSSMSNRSMYRECTCSLAHCVDRAAESAIVDPISNARVRDKLR